MRRISDAQSISDIGQRIARRHARLHVREQQLIVDQLIDESRRRGDRDSELAGELFCELRRREALPRELDRAPQLASAAHRAQRVFLAAFFDVAKLSVDFVQRRRDRERHVAFVVDLREKFRDRFDPEIGAPFVRGSWRKLE